MSLIFQDSFDGDSPDQLSSKFNGGTSVFVSIATGQGRNGTNALKIFDNGGALLIPVSSAGYLAGFAVKQNGFPLNASPAYLFRADPDYNLMTVRLNSLGGLDVWTEGPSPGRVASSANGLWLLNSWGHVQVKIATTWTAPIFPATIGTLAYTASVKFNNILVISGAIGGIPTNVTYANKQGPWFVNGGGTILYDDFYLLDTTTGSAPQNDFLGDLRSIAIFPNGVGAHSGFTPSTGGAANYTMVNENPDDGDTTYVGTNVPNTLDTYKFPVVSLPAGSLIYGVQHNQVARKDDAGSRSITSVCRPSSGTDNVGTPDVSIGDTYDTYIHEWERNPDTGSDWALADFNDGAGNNPTQFGPKCTV